MIINMAYGSGRRIRVVSWTVALIVSQSIQDAKIKDLWVREGAPPDALLIDVILQKNAQLSNTTVNFVIEHATFSPVEAGDVIPSQPVVLLNIHDAMSIFMDRTRNDGA